VLRKKLFRNIWSRKGSLLALIAIMVIGVGSYVGMTSLHSDLDAARRQFYAAYRMVDFTVDLKRAPPWAVDSLTDIKNVRLVQGRVNVTVRIDLPSELVPINGQAMSLAVPRRPALNDAFLKTGSWFSSSQAEEVIIGQGFADAHGLKAGHRLRVLLPDRQYELLIVGTAMSPEFVYVLSPGGGMAPDPARFGILYMPQGFLRKASDMDGAWNQLLGFVHNPEKEELSRTLDIISERLDSYGVLATTPIHDQPSAGFLRDELKGLRTQSKIVPFIFLGVAALVLNVLLGRVVRQQRGIIGTLKALGYSRSAILRHYLAFGGLVGLLAGLPGIAFGLWIQEQILSIYRTFYAIPEITGHYHWRSILGGLAISVFSALFGVARAVWKASQLEPAEAMRPPPPERVTRILPELIPIFWRRLSFRSKMILRAIFRNPVRSGITTLATCVSVALVVMTLSIMRSVDEMMAFQLVKVAHQDVTVTLREPVSDSASPEVGRMRGIQYTEAQLELACELTYGAVKRRVSITGLPAGNRLYTPLDKSEHKIEVPEQGLLLSTTLANKLGVKVGDNLYLRPLIGRRERALAPVVGTVDAYFGMPAFARIKYLSRLLGEERVISSVLTLSSEGSSGRSLSALKKLSPVVAVSHRLRAFKVLEQTFGALMKVMLSIQVFFAGLIAFGSVLNASLVSFSERQREVGTLRVLGYGPGAVAAVFAGESLLLGGLGIIAGIPLGILMITALIKEFSTDIFRFPVVIEIPLLAGSAFIIAVFLLAAQLIVTMMVKRFHWLEVLKAHE
jgi:putative ABC transport system permease protein